MGMIGNLLRVKKTELEEYLKNSTLLEERIYNDETENPCSTDIDKSWDGIIFLLTGESANSVGDHPLRKILFSEQYIDEDQDVGYGPAHYLTTEEVSKLNEQIAKITVQNLKEKFDPGRMTELEIYPTIWDEGDEAFNYLSSYFLEIQKFYSEASKNGEAIITFIN